MALKLFFFLALVCSPLAAGIGGSLSGTVADPTGAVMSCVSVTARNADTGLTQSTATNADGVYLFPVLPVGRYDLEIDQPGFAPFRKAGLSVAVDAAVRADIQLELGAHNEALTISDSGYQVETASTQMGERIQSGTITAVPLNGRSFTDLLALQPGVSPASSQQPNAVVMSGCTSAPPSGDLNAGNLSVSGQRETSNGFVVNGSSVEEAFNMGTALVPNLDSIQDFRVLTNNFDAEFGNYGGGQIVMTTKSGSNQVHGSGFDFLRNTALDSRNYFSSERARYGRNQFGGTMGGPIRKDKLFFFSDYQGTRMFRGIDTGLISVPSAANRAGNFSDIAGSPAAVNGNINSATFGQVVSAAAPRLVQVAARFSF